MKQFIARELRKAERRFGAFRVSLVIATSGTAAALAQASQAMRKTKTPGKAARPEASRWQIRGMCAG